MDEELIQKLVDQCVDKRERNGTTVEVLQSRKFAELSVRECMRMCDVAAIGCESHGHMKEANGCYSAKEYIEEHFGVEEDK